MPQPHERLFYEVMWRDQTRDRHFPKSWWIQQYFRRWTDAFDGGLFDSKEAAFASNANYRYWNMIGVKDHHQESLVGQAGEVEPVYDEYALSFFLFDPATRDCCYPQLARPGTTLAQSLEQGYLPVIHTRYSALGVEVEQKVLATTLGLRQRSVVLVRFRVSLLPGIAAASPSLCLALSPVGVTGVERHDKAGRISTRRLNVLRFFAAENRVEIDAHLGPVFMSSPDAFGVYGNAAQHDDPEHYLANNPFRDLKLGGTLNGQPSAQDLLAGWCSAVFTWTAALDATRRELSLDVLLPVDDYRGSSDVAELRAASPSALEAANRAFWLSKLASDPTFALPPRVEHLFDLYRTCRSHLLILADQGEIHPGPTIYDSFWIRDSSVESIACALAGDGDLAQRQIGTHYPAAFNFGSEQIGPVSAFGFFGKEHEKHDREWDSNGQALWAIGSLDRIMGPGGALGAALYSPYVLEGARWLRNNRSSFGLLHSGWSAEHLGDADKPHYWDDWWALAGLYEAARLAERIGATEVRELWDIFDDIKRATTDSMRWVLEQQRRQGHWETFIPTGPADVGRLDSTVIGALAYFHPCRLYMGPKLPADLDRAMRHTLDTIWAHFIDGGFRHDSAWNAYGPYLTLQLAHAFLLVGDVTRMDQCLAWSVHNAAYARMSREPGSSELWQVVLGAWNEQHAYPISKDYREFPGRSWYMGDIPHGWAAAEFLLLLRDILLFEADEDNDRQLYLAAGVPPHWLGDGEQIRVTGAPTRYGQAIGYTLVHRASSKRIELDLTSPPPAGVRLVYPCRFGSGIVSATANGAPLAVAGREIGLPPGTTRAVVNYV